MLHYYLVDDTMEIREVHTPNDGHDPFPVLMGRQRMPIDRNNAPGMCYYILLSLFDWF